MRKLAIALLILAGLLWSGSASAQLTVTAVPSGTSGCPPGSAVVCPCGSMDWIQVQAWEIPPVPASTITVQIIPVAGLCICPGQSPLSAVEGPSGMVTFTFIHLGGCVTTSFIASTTTPGVTPATSQPVSIKSPDLDGDCRVTLVDFGIFAVNYATAFPCCDYNCDGIVNLIDFAIFGQHFTHWC